MSRSASLVSLLLTLSIVASIALSALSPPASAAPNLLVAAVSSVSTTPSVVTSITPIPTVDPATTSASTATATGTTLASGVPTPSPTTSNNAASATPTPDATAYALATLYAAATAMANINATATANAAPTATPTAAPTPDATANALATLYAAATAMANINATATANAGATAMASATASAPTFTATPTNTATPSAAAPGNDDFGSAVQIDGFSYNTSENSSGATLAGDDPTMGAGSGQNSATVWYKFTASQNGRVDFNTTGSSYDTVLAAFTGSRGSLNLVASNDDANGTHQSEMAFDIQSGTTYYVEVAGYASSGGGQLQLSATLVSSSGTATPTTTPSGSGPANDDFGSAVQISSFPYSGSENSVGATLASDDPTMGAGSGQNSATVWYKFTASQTGRVDFNTTGSSYDTVLAAFTGNRGSLNLVTSNDDANGTHQSEMAFDIQSGTTYYLEVAGYGSSGGGQLQLSATLVSATGTPIISGTATPGVLGATPPALTSVGGGAGETPVPNTSDPRYFQQTGYRITNDAFWDYFQKRGGVRTFGYPISRQVLLFNFRVQLFQRGLLQEMPDGSVATMNLLDSGLMPYTQINGSTFPGQDPGMIQSAPLASDPNYAENAIAFVKANVPDQWNGQSVNFLQTFLSTVRYEDAFPQGDADPALVPLLNLEFWGLPTSPPAYDPHNHNFVYQRFQRGIMHYDATNGLTQGLLLGDYFKSVITGQNLPPDLDLQAVRSLFYHQYDRTKPGYLARPVDLQGTNLVGAFEMDLPQ